MSGDELRAWRDFYVLSRIQLAGILGVDRKTILRWEVGHTPVPKWLPLALEAIGGQRARLATRLRERRAMLHANHAKQRALRVAL